MRPQGRPCTPEIDAREIALAEAEKERVAAFWAERGVHPDTLGLRIDPVAYNPSLRCATYGLRSNMINGLPPQGANHNG